MSSILRSLKLIKSRIISQIEAEKKESQLDENELKLKRQNIDKLLCEKMKEVKNYQKMFKVEIGGQIFKISHHIVDNCLFQVNKDFLINKDSENEINFLDIPLSYLQIVLKIIRVFQKDSVDSTQYSLENPLEINLGINEDILQIQNFISSIFTSEKVFDLIKLNKYSPVENSEIINNVTTVRQTAVPANDRRRGRDPRYHYNNQYDSEYSY